MGRPKVARGARGRPAHPMLFLFDVPSMQPWSAQSKPCEGVRASKEMNLGVTREAQGKITRLGQVHVSQAVIRCRPGVATAPTPTSSGWADLGWLERPGGRPAHPVLFH